MFIWGDLPKTFVNLWRNVSVKAADLLKSSYTAPLFVSVKWLIIAFRGQCELLRALNRIKIECDHNWSCFSIMTLWHYMLERHMVCIKLQHTLIQYEYHNVWTFWPFPRLSNCIQRVRNPDCLTERIFIVFNLLWRYFLSLFFPFIYLFIFVALTQISWLKTTVLSGLKYLACAHFSSRRHLL